MDHKMVFGKTLFPRKLLDKDSNYFANTQSMAGRKLAS